MPPKNKPKPENKKMVNVLFYEGKIPIRKKNIYSIYIPQNNLVRIAKIITGSASDKLSVAKVIAVSGTPCECCKDKPVQLTIDGKIVEIPRGLLYTSKGSNGVTHQRKNKSE